MRNQSGEEITACSFPNKCYALGFRLLPFRSMARNRAYKLERTIVKKAGIAITDGHRWGLHNLRHSLSNWLVNKVKENPKTVQGILGHSRIQTTLDLYVDEDLDDMISAQDKFFDAVGIESKTVQ